jgi:hypothetical protein
MAKSSIVWPPRERSEDLGDALGRLIESRPPVACHMEEILA